jgi:hypothetical protein
MALKPLGEYKDILNLRIKYREYNLEKINYINIPTWLISLVTM